MLEQLPVAREVALRRRDVGVGLDRVQPARLSRHPAVVGRARDQHVVLGPVGDRPEDRLDRARAGLDVDALVADGVAVERRRRRAGDDVADPDVVVAEHHPPALDGARTVALARRREEPVQREVARLERVVGRAGLVGQLPDLGVDDRRRDAPVVEQRRVGREALLPHQLLAVEVAVGVAVLDVALGRDRADAAVVRHGARLGRPGEQPGPPEVRDGGPLRATYAGRNRVAGRQSAPVGSARHARLPAGDLGLLQRGRGEARCRAGHAHARRRCSGGS